MRCHRCGVDYPSEYYFTSTGDCIECAKTAPAAGKGAEESELAPFSGSTSRPGPFAALDAYAHLVATLGWLVIAGAVIVAVLALGTDAGTSVKLAGVLMAVFVSVSGLGLVAGGQLMLCIRAIQADTHTIAAAVATSAHPAS